MSAQPDPASPAGAAAAIAHSGLSPAFPARAAWGTAKSLRAWQAAALQRYLEENPRDFLAAATPGAGKTSFALTLASNLLARRQIDRLIIVDRKSTRLNSSHANISYAVFCLKKKKT